MIDKLLTALMSAIHSQIGVHAVLMPQTAKTGSARIELYLAGISVAGESSCNHSMNGYETLSFTALFKTNGTGSAWVQDTILKERKLVSLETAPMQLELPAPEKITVKALWNRQGSGQYEYPEEGDGAMPVSYVVSYKVDVRYPAYLIDQDTNTKGE